MSSSEALPARKMVGVFGAIFSLARRSSSAPGTSLICQSRISRSVLSLRSCPSISLPLSKAWH